jgi:cell division septation protein DedD
VATEVREHEEHGYSTRYLVLIFLVCVATCGVFFSLGFVVGFNEHGSHAMPAAEVVTAPSAIPAPINAPPDSTPPTAPPAAPSTAAGTTPDTEVIPPTGPGPSPVAAPKPSTPAAHQPAAPPPAPAKPAAKPATPPAPVGGEVAQGVTLQVVALRNKQDAEHVVDILKGKGYPVFLVTPEFAHAGDDFFRVQVGPFKYHEDAVKVRDRLKQDGFNPYIRH